VPQVVRVLTGTADIVKGLTEKSVVKGLVQRCRLGKGTSKGGERLGTMVHHSPQRA
jgi:hypothetical protein